MLARVLERIGKGDTLVVVRIDRLARSLSHLLEVIERLEAKGAFFRSIQDPIDTGSPQGKFTLQVLGAAAEFERALIRERTKAGLASARTKGRVGGNPGLRAKDPAALRQVRLARQDGYIERLNETAQDWVPHVRRLRSDLAWEDVVRIINTSTCLNFVIISSGFGRLFVIIGPPFPKHSAGPVQMGRLKADNH